jgi:hypothetical protein
MFLEISKNSSEKVAESKTTPIATMAIALRMRD